MTATTARANANIALVKYWGKRNDALNLPARGSLSLTLDALSTTASVEFGGGDRDVLAINGQNVEGDKLQRLSQWLDVVRTLARTKARANIVTNSNFPIASGLASSASAFAALALAASRAAGLAMDQRELSVLARLGSGSAARSIFGGLVEMLPGQRDDGDDSYARRIESPWTTDLRMVVAIVGGGAAKPWSSRDAMTHCRETSPLYSSWLDTVPTHLAGAREAIEKNDLRQLGEITEASALTMHASMWAARPAIMYWLPETVRCIERVHELRADGAPAFLTIDAGPHVKVLTDADHADQVAAAMGQIDGVTRTILSAAGNDTAEIP